MGQHLSERHSLVAGVVPVVSAVVEGRVAVVGVADLDLRVVVSLDWPILGDVPFRLVVVARHRDQPHVPSRSLGKQLAP